MVRAIGVVVVLGVMACERTATPSEPLGEVSAPIAAPAPVAAPAAKPIRPHTIDDAAREPPPQLARRSEAPRPRLVVAGASTTVHERVTRFGSKGAKPKASSVVVEGPKLADTIATLVAETSKDPLWVPPVIACKDACCSFTDDDAWGGATLVRLEQVCFALGPEGLPTAIDSIWLARYSGIAVVP